MGLPKIGGKGGTRAKVTVERVLEAWFKINHQTLPLVCDDEPKTLRTRINWRDEGWYSLDGEGVYQEGIHPTTNRIWIGFDYPGYE